MKVLILIVLLLAASATAFAFYYLYTHGTHSFTINFAGMERKYLLHTPPGYDGTTPVPLVIVLHGYADTPAAIESHSGFSTKSDTEGFIVVYPEGLGQSWNVGWGFFEEYAFTNNIDDVGFIRALIDSLQGKFAIDGNRIYVAGFSDGAMMAYRLASELSDRITAVASVEGTIGGHIPNSPLFTIREPAQPVSIVVFHGTADTNVPYNGGDGTSGAYFLSVNESVSFWVRHDGCSKEPLKEVSGDTIKETYSGGRSGTEVVLFTIVNGTNTWPASATDEIWAFFKNHPKND